MAKQPEYDSIGAGMLKQDANIDRRNCKRVVPMEVLSLGMSRTGTMSMKEAFLALGIRKCYHFSEIFYNMKDCDMWNEGMKAKFQGVGKPYGKTEFDQLLGHCGAITDVPAILFWKELADAYPDAKIVLVERDEDKWATSFEGLLEGVLNPMGKLILAPLDPMWWGRLSSCGRLWVHSLLGTNDLATAKRNSRAMYRQHYADIRKTIPKERLLEYKLGDGWEPLCEFLGKDVPNIPFPHINEADALKDAFTLAIGKGLKNSLFNLAMGIGAASVVGTLVWRYMKS